MLNHLNQLASELYAEFGFSTCTNEQQEKILQMNETNVNCNYDEID